jgi:hypothetical protein
MGATGASGTRLGSSSENRVFGIRSARRLDDDANPAGARFDNSGDRIVISANSDEGKDIVFQFKLGRNDTMKITAYDPNVPSRGKTSVSAERPSLDSVINNPKSTSEDRQNAMKIRDMFQRTDSGIKESSLGRIANELKKKKRKRGQLA